MKRALNTLYVTKPGSYLSKQGNTLVVEKDKQKVVQLPIHTVNQVICFGFEIKISPPLMLFCSENSVSISWLTENGRFLGRVEGPIKGNVLLRRQQYRMADDSDATLDIAKCITAAKINNSRINLQRCLRNNSEHKYKETIAFNIDKLAYLLRHLKDIDTIDQVRGAEGEAAGLYFAVFDHLISNQKDEIAFEKRNRRPPTDIVNAMLSFTYTLLVHDVRSALETVGLDAYVGFLHRDRPGRPSLALDLMEEFRAPLADRLVLNLINRKQVNAKGFQCLETGEVKMTDDCRKTLVVAYQNRKKETIRHPFTEETIEIGLVFLFQARLLARHVRGDLNHYPAMIWR